MTVNRTVATYYLANNQQPLKRQRGWVSSTNTRNKTNNHVTDHEQQGHEIREQTRGDGPVVQD